MIATITTTTTNRTLGDGMGFGFLWVLSVIMGKGAAVSDKAISNHTDSVIMTIQTFAVTIILRLLTMFAQVQPLTL